MKKILAVIMVCVVFSAAADLTISGQSGRTYNGGTYNKLVIKNSSNITVKNCKFSASSGSVGLIDAGSRNCVIENCEFDGKENACTGVAIKGTKSVLKNSLIENIADDGILLSGCSEITVQGNEMRNLVSKGTDGRIDGPCYNGHSDGFEISNCHSSVVEGNLIYDIKGTSGIYFSSYADKCTNMRVVNNMVYVPECGFAVYIKDVTGLEFHNNTIWKGEKGGVTLGHGISGLKMYNNICSTINTTHFGISLNSNHDLKYNLMGLTNQGVTAGANDVWAPNVLFQRIPPVIGGSILYDVKPEDFNLQSGSAAINKGTNTPGIPATDFFGNPRTAPYDMGAVEYQGAAISREELLRQRQAAVGIQNDGKYYSLTGSPADGNTACTGLQVLYNGNTIEKVIVIH